MSFSNEELLTSRTQIQKHIGKSLIQEGHKFTKMLFILLISPSFAANARFHVP